ncbi:MAG: thiol:disulfide interchange protein DsbA/DsbL [Burkholderiales bacterium]
MARTIDPTKRTTLGLLLFAGAVAGCSTTGARAPGARPDEGIDYRLAETPQPTRAAPGRIEVVELFWYGCPHCNAMEPGLVAWARALPPDVAFRKVHLGLGPRWVPHQRLFCALERVGRDASLDARVFRAIHVDGRALGTRDEAAEVVAASGVDRGAFVDAWESDAVREAMREADAFAAALGVQGVPTLVVDGRLVTSPGMTGSYHATLSVVDALLAKVRARTA